MKIKILCIGILALSMTTGAALSRRGDGTSALDDTAMMSPFYTDASMTTLKPEADFTAAWKALKDEDRADMIRDCGDEDLESQACRFLQRWPFNSAATNRGRYIPR